FLALDRLAEEIGADIKKSRFQGLTGKALLGNTPVLLLKPMTYMNNSGHAVGEAADYYRISPDHVIVLVDDVHLGSGLIRIRKSGSDGGHNGLKDIENALGTDEYPRVRFGVGEKSHPEMELKDWVLGKLTESEMEGLRPAFEKTGEICRLLIAGEAEKAMGLFNGKALEK
ncbi:MAG: aminoacyl-tRNA hydrolase, partial [Clostridia bacterium]|nr:aminoacyl-tRNA hydrolase [Clostridia bacterium]